MLELYRTALRLRRAEPGLGDGPMTWLPAPGGVLAFARGQRRLRLRGQPLGGPVELPGDAGVLLASGPLRRRQAAADTAVWLRITGARPQSPPETAA